MLWVKLATVIYAVYSVQSIVVLTRSGPTQASGSKTARVPPAIAQITVKDDDCLKDNGINEGFEGAVAVHPDELSDPVKAAAQKIYVWSPNNQDRAIRTSIMGYHLTCYADSQAVQPGGSGNCHITLRANETANDKILQQNEVYEFNKNKPQAQWMEKITGYTLKDICGQVKLRGEVEKFDDGSEFKPITPNEILTQIDTACENCNIADGNKQLCKNWGKKSFELYQNCGGVLWRVAKSQNAQNQMIKDRELRSHVQLLVNAAKKKLDSFKNPNSIKVVGEIEAAINAQTTYGTFDKYMEQMQSSHSAGSAPKFKENWSELNKLGIDKASLDAFLVEAKQLYQVAQQDIQNKKQQAQEQKK